MNNQHLWDAIKSFKLDESNDSYTFSIRLAFENKWSHYITQQAILEYKKFMFLAATSNNMVSPSETVDIVWHQHLIFTQSYNSFCNLLGKRIDHIPSTHNSEEKIKFAQAKERTRLLYEQHFGKQPDVFWNYSNVYDSIPITKARQTKHDTFKVIAFILLSGLFTYLLAPLISKIPNPAFLLGFISIWIFSLVSIFLSYKKNLLALMQQWQSSSIIANLTPMELVSIKRQNASYVTHYYVSRMVKQKNIVITSDNKLKFKSEPNVQDPIEKVLYAEIKKYSPIFYSSLLKGINSTPLIIQIHQVRIELKKIFSSSIECIQMILATAYLFVFSILTLSVRLTIGIDHHKDVGYLIITIVLCIISAFFFIIYIRKYFWGNIFPNEFERLFIPTDTSASPYPAWQWKYYLGGSIIASSLLPMVGYTSRHNGGNCGNSCGSSCSNSCGGGGGDGGGGCGGCGGD